MKKTGRFRKLRCLRRDDMTNRDLNQKTGKDLNCGTDNPDPSRQKIFALVNILLSILFCCVVVGIFPLAFSILAMLFASETQKAGNRDEANRRLSAAVMLNVIAVVTMAILLILIAVLVVRFEAEGGLERFIRERLPGVFR